jgi:hypothetical protein
VSNLATSRRGSTSGPACAHVRAAGRRQLERKWTGSKRAPNGRCCLDTPRQTWHRGGAAAEGGDRERACESARRRQGSLAGRPLAASPCKPHEFARVSISKFASAAARTCHQLSLLASARDICMRAAAAANVCALASFQVNDSGAPPGRPLCNRRPSTRFDCCLLSPACCLERCRRRRPRAENGSE